MIVHFKMIFKFFLKVGENMSCAGVICEFNPFHNGHKFLIEKIKANYADEVICIMSGSFVQRGDIAITDKYSRTKAALQNGADMVVELPTVYTLSCAQIFAHSGVQLAYELGCDLLCFGAENSLAELEDTLAALDSGDTQEEIATRMHSGTYYPRAVAEALGGDYAEIIGQPNNLLALEYIRACREYGIRAVAIPREGVTHDSQSITGDFASASKIRDMIRHGEDYTPYTPMTVKLPYYSESIEYGLVYILKKTKPEKTEDIAGVSEGINNRLYKYAQQYNSLVDILSAAKTKRYTMARLRRIVLCIYLNITQKTQQRPVPYIRILGVKREKSHLISSRSLPLLVDIKSGYDALEPSAKEIFDIDVDAVHAVNSSRVLGYPLNEFQYGVIKI